MSELQLDDPDPLPSKLEYPDNNYANSYHARAELSAEREGIVGLSNCASSILDSDVAVGVQTERHAVAKGGMLRRQINNGTWVYSFVDVQAGVKQRYTWRIDDNDASWSRKYPESLDDVRARLEDVFYGGEHHAETQPEQQRSRLMRTLAALASRQARP